MPGEPIPTDSTWSIPMPAALRSVPERSAPWFWGDFLSRTAHAGLVACFGQQLELLIHHARDDVGAAQVDADIIFHTKTPLHFVALPAGRLLFY